MKTVRIHPKYTLIDIKGLVLIYLLLSIITILFWRTVFPEILQSGTVPDIVDLGVFFTIPAVLVVFLGASLLSLFRELITRQLGRRFHIQLLAYFILIVIFASLPAIIISSQTALELTRFWKTIDVDAAMRAAQEFALETYSLHGEKVENLLKNQDFDSLIAAQGAAGEKASPGTSVRRNHGDPRFRLTGGRDLEKLELSGRSGSGTQGIAGPAAGIYPAGNTPGYGHDPVYGVSPETDSPGAQLPSGNRF